MKQDLSDIHNFLSPADENVVSVFGSYLSLSVHLSFSLSLF